MRIMMVIKYPPIQGGVSRDSYWLARLLAEQGHEVTVVTNAFEVEDEFRLSLEPGDNQYLQGEFGGGSIRLISTYIDPKQIYIPQNNPTTSKIVGLALQAIEESRPDVIYSHYLEPYGFSSMVLESLTGIPYVLRHAGSDVGKLMLTDQLKPAYKEVFRRASVILSSARMFGTLLSVGVQPHQIVNVSVSYLHPDLFRPAGTSLPRANNRLVLGVYGKAGTAKGTFALLKTLRYLKDQGEQVFLRAHWGGKIVDQVREIITELEISDRVELLPLVPHWRIPEFVHSCDASLFLEHGFTITQHTPTVPMELLTCGTAFITTAEIAGKSIYQEVLKDGSNCLIVDDPNDTPALADRILTLKDPKLRLALASSAGSTLNTQAMRERAVHSANIVLETALANQEK